MFYKISPRKPPILSDVLIFYFFDFFALGPEGDHFLSDEWKKMEINWFLAPRAIFENFNHVKKRKEVCIIKIVECLDKLIKKSWKSRFLASYLTNCPIRAPKMGVFKSLRKNLLVPVKVWKKGCPNTHFHFHSKQHPLYLSVGCAKKSILRKSHFQKSRLIFV